MIDEREHLERALRRFRPEPGIVERVYRRRDRKQRNRRIGTAALALVLAAVAIGGVVRAFRLGETSRPANLPSGPGWSRVPFPVGTISSITAGGPGLVAVGAAGPMAPDSPAQTPAIWISSDGRTWSQAEIASADFVAFTDVTAGGPGLVAVGIESGREGAPVWTSTDGLTWSRAPSHPALEGARLRAVVPGGPGLVAVGSDLEGPMAWFSSDGLRWEKATMPPLPAGVLVDEAWIQDVAVGGDRLIAVGEIGIGSSGVYHYDPVIWTSTDGVTWTPVPLDPEVFPRSTQLRSLAAGPGGFVVVGGRDGRWADPSVWTSADGLTWRRVPPEQDAFGSLATGQPDKNPQLYFDVSSVAAGSDGYVAVGEDAWCTYGPPGLCSPAEAAVWRSTDGETWVRVPSDPVFQLDGAKAGTTSAIAAWGTRFVAAVNFADTGVAVWISEPPEE